MHPPDRVFVVGTAKLLSTKTKKQARSGHSDNFLASFGPFCTEEKGEIPHITTENRRMRSARGRKPKLTLLTIQPVLRTPTCAHYHPTNTVPEDFSPREGGSTITSTTITFRLPRKINMQPFVFSNFSVLILVTTLLLACLNSIKSVRAIHVSFSARCIACTMIVIVPLPFNSSSCYSPRPTALLPNSKIMISHQGCRHRAS